MFSADSHVCEPPDLWRERLERRFRCRAPRVVRGFDGRSGDWFVCENITPRSVFAAFGAGVPEHELKARSVKGFDAAPASIWDPASRLREQDVDGVEGEVLYPTMTDLLFGVVDRDFRWACLRAYNDFLSEYCSENRDRLVGVAVVDLDDPAAAVVELERTRANGLRGVVVRGDPGSGLGYERPELNYFWAAAVESRTPVTLHRSAVRKDLTVDVVGALTDYTLIPNQAQRLLTGMLLAGVWERHPSLKLICCEFDIGWIPQWLSRIDRAFERYGRAFDMCLSRLPSEQVRSSILFTFQRDIDELESCLNVLTLDSFMWSSDYPHADATWPDSRSVATKFRERWNRMLQVSCFRERCLSLYGMVSDGASQTTG